MLVMGLDTALKRCSVAILKAGEVLADESVAMERGHAEHLAPMAASALERAGVSVRDLDRVGVVVGPGGFTGVRVALSFARGLGVGTGIEIAGVTSLAALSAEAGAPLAGSVIDARRGQVYAGLYHESGEIALPPFISEPEKALEMLAHKAGGAPVRLVGSGAALLGRVPSGWTVSGPEEIDAKVVAQLAAAAPAPKGPPAPLYLRAPDAKPGKPGPFEGRRPS